MKTETKNWFLFSIISVFSVILLTAIFFHLYSKNTFIDFSGVESSLFRFSLYCFGLIMGTILPITFLQKWLVKISYGVIGLSGLVLLAYIFFYNPALGEPRFYFLGEYATYASDCFGIIEVIFQIGLGLCLAAFIRKIIAKKNG